MNCLNFDEIKNEPCDGTAEYPFNGCDKECGWMYKTNVGQLKKVMNGQIKWDVPWGIKYWSVGKYLHYKQLI